MRYIGILNNDGTTCTASYSPMYAANAEDDMRRDARVENYKLGFATEQEALDWANAQ